MFLALKLQVEEGDEIDGATAGSPLNRPRAPSVTRSSFWQLPLRGHGIVGRVVPSQGALHG